MITHLLVKVVKPITKHPRSYLKSQYPVVGASIYTNMVLLEIFRISYFCQNYIDCLLRLLSFLYRDEFNRHLRRGHLRLNRHLCLN